MSAIDSHTQRPLTTVTHSIVVEAPIDVAFSVFTEQFDRIKPREHNLLGAEVIETVFERRVGGHLYDRAVDGSECRWARVLEYDPPRRMVISWDISPSWSSRPTRSERARSRSSSWRRARTAPESGSSTATSTATARAGTRSAMASPAIRGGRST